MVSKREADAKMLCVGFPHRANAFPLEGLYPLTHGHRCKLTAFGPQGISGLTESRP